MSKFAIGLTGPIGSGVSTVSAALQKAGFQAQKVSDLIRKEISPDGVLRLEVPRSELQDFGNKKRAEDPAFWAKKALEEIDKKGFGENIVIEGLKNPEEIEYLSQKFGLGFFLVAAIASKRVRWERVKDAYRGNESEFKQDDERDSDEDIKHGQMVSRCVQDADYVYVNEDDFGSKDTQVRKVGESLSVDVEVMKSCRRMGGQSGRRTPKEDEIHMAMAWAQSFSSACIKRQVGAVIVGANGLPLSSGFNENPVGMDPCVRKYSACFKDDAMHISLERMSDFFCPKCGAKNSALKNPWRCKECGENLKLRFFPSRNMELCTAIHAEERAIRSLMGRDAKDATIFSTTFPCFQCARYIVDCKIKRIVYVEAYPVEESRKYLEDNNVKVNAFSGFKARAFNVVFRQTT